MFRVLVPKVDLKAQIDILRVFFDNFMIFCTSINEVYSIGM